MMTKDAKPSGSTSEIVAMKLENTPVTLKNWLDFIYPDGVPDEWQQEMDVPEELQEEFQKEYS
jgi:hypothetical protein